MLFKEIEFPLESYSGGTFGGKARVRINFEHEEIWLRSYSTDVCLIKPNKFFNGKHGVVYVNHYSNTTNKHISEFIRQYDEMPAVYDFKIRKWH